MRAIARHLLGLLIILCGMLPTMGQSKERLIWLVRDLPPFTIFEGTAKGQGVVDNLLPRLIAQMPEYDHSIVRVNRARGLQMLGEPSFTCDPTLLWTPERAKFVRFSIPSLGVLSSGLVIRKQDQAALARFSTTNRSTSKACSARLTQAGHRRRTQLQRSNRRNPPRTTRHGLEPPLRQ